MELSELQALISLLEDEDPEVEMHVRKKLISLGQNIVPQLETFWEYDADDFVQQRIEDVIHTIQSRETFLALREWRAEGGGDLLKGWYWATRYHYPSLELQPYADQINRMVHRIWLDFQPHSTLKDKIMMVNRMVFVREKFRSNRRSVFTPANYFLNGLLETQKGGPISLGMLMLVICQALDLPVQGITLPGYFVLTYQSEEEEFFMDPFNRGAFFSREELSKFLKEMKIDQEERYYRPTSSISILIHWIKILQEAYRRRKQFDKVKAQDQLLHYIDLDVEFP